MTPEELGNPNTAREISIAERFWGSLEDEIEFARSFYFGLPLTDRAAAIIGDDREFYDAWQAKERTRIELAGREVAGRLAPDSKVLDLGCASGQVACEIARHGHTVQGVDLTERAIEVGCPILEEIGLPVEIQVGNALELPFEDGSFDAVVSWDVVEHISDQRGFLCEIQRVLRPGGLTLIHTDNDVRVQLGVWFRRLTCWTRGQNPFRWRHAYAGLEGGHCALVTPQVLAETARNLGFESVESRYSGGWSLAPGLTAPKFVLEARRPATDSVPERESVAAH